MALRVVRVGVSTSAHQQFRALGHRFGDEGFEPREAGGGDLSADVHGGGRVERRADPEGPDAVGEDGEQSLVGAGEGDDALDADAVLAGGLKHPAHKDARDRLYIFRVVEDYGGVFAAEFDAERREGFGGRCGDVVGYGPRTDECYV